MTLPHDVDSRPQGAAALLPPACPKGARVPPLLVPTLFCSLFAIGFVWAVLLASRAIAASPGATNDIGAARFELSPTGFIRHWLVAGPHAPRYAGPPGPDHVLRRDALDYSTATPPSTATLDQPGPFGLPWRFHDAGRNEFVELSTFYKEPAVVDAFAFTEISAPRAGEWQARLWAAGAVDLWVNNEHVTRLNVTRYRYADAAPVVLTLKPGLNRLCVRLQCYGVRDTRMLFGVFLEKPDGVVVAMPGAARIAEAQRWIDTVRAPTRDRLESATPAPFDARVAIAGREPLPWSAGASQWTVDGSQGTMDTRQVDGSPSLDGLGALSLSKRQAPSPAQREQSAPAGRVPPQASERTPQVSGLRSQVSASQAPGLPAVLTVEAAVDGVVLQRPLDIPANRPGAQPIEGDRRRAHLEYIARAGVGGEAPPHWNATLLPLLARRLLADRQEATGDGRQGTEEKSQKPGADSHSLSLITSPAVAEADASSFGEALALVDARRDCADFALAGLLRGELLGLFTPQESAEIRRAALAFRYWDDEPGSDAMAFRSENHSLLFHGCQLLAGRLYPEEVFSNSGRRGKEQAAIALPRIRTWLEKIEARGFEEFNSSTYMPITIAAMLNIVDFAGDAELSARMGAQVDRVFRDLADHSFGGGVITPQGRVYRDVLFPESSGTQALLAFATDVDADLASPRAHPGRGGDWVVFPASSPRYQPPADLPTRVREYTSRAYRHADVQIVLEKTPAYLLTSLAVPAAPREGEHPENDLRPGGAGYQQHLWQATLGRDCHVFVNHPGGFFDGTKSRPGYWHGNGLLPRVRQQGNMLQAIHVIADGTQTQPEITREAWQWPGASSVRPFAVHPIAFTHAHWPSDSFDREVTRGHWRFGQKGRGLIGLWCSEPLVPHDDMLTGRELRANSYESAWLVICGDQEKEQSLEAFMAACEARRPTFDRNTYTLSVEGEAPTRWWERSEPMPR